MSDPLHDRQVALEHLQARLDLQRYTAKNAKEPGKTPAGERLVLDLIEPVAEAIESFMAAVVNGKATRNSTVFPYLCNIEPMQAAYLVTRVTLDKAANRSSLTGAALAVAAAVEHHIMFCGIAKTDPGLYRRALESLVRYPAGYVRNQALKRLLDRCNIARLQWRTDERVALGTKLIELLEQATGLISMHSHREGTRRTVNRVELTAGAEAWLSQNLGKCALIAPMYKPMLVPPRPWVSAKDGGYLTGAVKSWLIRVRNQDQLIPYMDCATTMPNVLAAVNAVQATPWRVNKAMLDIIEEARVMNSMLAVFPPANDEPLPAVPAWLQKTTDTKSLPPALHEEFITWKAKRAKAYAANGEAGAKRGNILRKLEVAKEFANEEAIYLPYYLDFRGRMYPFCESLNPQGDDMTKSLLEFAEGKALGADGAYWLAVHLANSYATGSIDKAPLDERVQWVMDHEREIMDSGMSPLDGEKFWHGAENPFQFLAACIEWCGYKVQGDAYVSHLPVNMDGSCSGLQHYSALLLDETGGAAVNLVPSEKPADVYTAVATEAQSACDACNDTAAVPWYGDRVIRKLVKQPTMTMCYAATKYGMRQQIEVALRKLDNGVENSYLGGHENFPASVFLAGIVWEAINNTVVAARRGMDFLKSCAEVMSKADVAINWVAPSGFMVSQRYSEDIGSKVQVHYNGTRLELTIRKDGTKIESRRQASGIAPNYVHSLDSAHLMATVNKGREYGIDYWSVIHDSFGTHAANVGLLNNILREAFVEQYSVNRLEEFRQQQHDVLTAIKGTEYADTLPSVPPMGNLDIEAVRASEFFFA